MDICPKCGLPKEACVCEDIAKTEQNIKIDVVKRKFGKIITLITGFDKSVNMKETARQLKTELACGGTIKNNVIELQGEHKRKAKEILVRMGFPEASIG
jgi:translation initiation factor 1